MERKYQVLVMSEPDKPAYQCTGFNAAMDCAEAIAKDGAHVVVEEISLVTRKVAEFGPTPPIERE